MTVIRLGPFLGANTALPAKMLANNVGVLSLNHRPDRGDLRPWKEPLSVKTGLAASRQTIFMFPRDAVSDTVYWLVWGTVVHAIRGFRAADTTKRTYYTGDGAPKSTDNVLAFAGEPYPTAYRDLGVPKPINQMTLTETLAGTGDDETRFYAYTYLTDWDEEGPPNVSAAVTCKPGANFNITGMSLAPSGAGENRGINRIRIYRTVTGDAGSTFYHLATIAIATTSTDNALVPGTDTLQTKEYALPPADLKHLTFMWNGIACGISGNSVRYCELNRIHAWPAKYETLVKDTPIALAVFQKTLVIGTAGRPRVVTGSLPEAMDDDPVELIAPVLSARSMVAFDHGALWASADGVAYVGSNGPPRILTAGVINPDDWKLLNPSTMIASQYRGLYVCFYDSGGGVMKGFALDPMNPDAGLLGIEHADIQACNGVFFDPLERELYLLVGTTIRKWNAGASNMTASFRSKTFMMPKPTNLGHAQVIADTYPLTLTLYADARAPWVRSVTSRKAFTLPSGFKADDYSVRIDTANDATGLVLASTIEELKAT